MGIYKIEIQKELLHIKFINHIYLTNYCQDTSITHI